MNSREGVATFLDFYSKWKLVIYKLDNLFVFAW
jgi:hypothetical protein